MGNPSEVVASRSLHTTPFLVFTVLALAAGAFHALVAYLNLMQRKKP